MFFALEYSENLLILRLRRIDVERVEGKVIECAPQFEVFLFAIFVLVVCHNILSRVHRAPNRLDHFEECLVVFARLLQLMDPLRFLRLKLLGEDHLRVVIAELHVRSVAIKVPLRKVQVGFVHSSQRCNLAVAINHLRLPVADQIRSNTSLIPQALSNADADALTNLRNQSIPHLNLLFVLNLLAVLEAAFALWREELECTVVKVGEVTVDVAAFVHDEDEEVVRLLAMVHSLKINRSNCDRVNSERKVDHGNKGNKSNFAFRKQDFLSGSLPNEANPGNDEYEIDWDADVHEDPVGVVEPAPLLVCLF